MNEQTAAIVVSAMWTTLGYVVGSRTGRGVLGAVCGFLMGPIGVLVAMFIPSTSARLGRWMPTRRSNDEPVADWYDDPRQRHEYRYFDGENWTLFVASNGVASVETCHL